MISWPGWCWRQLWSRLGVGYPVALGLPGIYGLYPTINPLLVLCAVQFEPHPGAGPDLALAAVILSVVLPLSGGDPLRAATLAGMLAVVSGTVLILMASRAWGS